MWKYRFGGLFVCFLRNFDSFSVKVSIFCAQFNIIGVVCLLAGLIVCFLSIACDHALSPYLTSKIYRFFSCYLETVYSSKQH